MKKDYIYLESMRIVKECRDVLIEDTLKSNSLELYDFLYSDSNSEIYKTKLELYELKWLELHWNKINEIIEKKECLAAEKKNLYQCLRNGIRII